MFENQILMRSYKEIKNKHKHLNLEKEYEEDNYLVQTLKRTSKLKYDTKIVEDQNNLKSLLTDIYKKIRLENDPKIKVIKTENDDFQKDYRCLSENFQKSTNIIFKDLIRKYNERGYKIPNLTYQHNLFKINALIEENNDKLELALKEDKKKKNPMIVNKTFAYIKKMKYIINLLSNKDDNNNVKRQPKFSLTTNLRKSAKNSETNEEIKQSIEKLRILIDKNPLLDTEQRRSILLPHRRPSFVDRNKFNSLNLKLRKSNKDNKSMKNNNLNGIFSIDNSIGNGNGNQIGDKKNNDLINMLSKRTNSNESNKSNNSNKSSQSFKSNKSVNSQKEVINNANKRKKEDILFFAPSISTNTKNENNNCMSFNVKDIFNRNSKPLINLKSQVKLKEKESQIEKTNTLSMVNSDKESTLYNKKTCYSNTNNDNYKKIKLINNKRNIKPDNHIHYKPFVISLKKNKIKFKNISNHKAKNALKLNQFISRSMALSKTPKVAKSNYVRTQTEDKKYNKNNNPYSLKSLTKTQKTIYKRNSDNKTSNDYLQKMYKRLQWGNYSNIEGLIRKYLKDIKHYGQEKEETVISHYNYQNLKTNLTELNRKISLDDLGKKTERIYLNNQIIKRVLPLLRTMKDKEINIDRFEKIVSSGA